MRLGAHAFLYADTGQSLIDRCIEIALVFHCDPFSILDRSEREVNVLYERTAVAMQRMRAEE